jgi:hypothetical protein
MSGGVGLPAEAGAAAGAGAAAPINGAAADDAPEPADAKPAPMSADDAADNFKTVVESYISRHTRDGAWPYAEKGRTARLTLVSVDSGSVRKTGADVYAGAATLRDARTRKTRRLEFTADFSGPTWKVVRVRPLPMQPAK